MTKKNNIIGITFTNKVMASLYAIGATTGTTSTVATMRRNLNAGYENNIPGMKVSAGIADDGDSYEIYIAMSEAMIEAIAKIIIALVLLLTPFESVIAAIWGSIRRIWQQIRHPFGRKIDEILQMVSDDEEPEVEVAEDVLNTPEVVRTAVVIYDEAAKTYAQLVFKKTIGGHIELDTRTFVNAQYNMWVNAEPIARQLEKMDADGGLFWYDISRRAMKSMHKSGGWHREFHGDYQTADINLGDNEVAEIMVLNMNVKGLIKRDRNYR